MSPKRRWPADVDRCRHHDDRRDRAAVGWSARFGATPTAPSRSRRFQRRTSVARTHHPAHRQHAVTNYPWHAERMAATLHLTQDDDADELLSADPFALLI